MDSPISLPPNLDFISCNAKGVEVKMVPEVVVVTKWLVGDDAETLHWPFILVWLYYVCISVLYVRLKDAAHIWNDHKLGLNWITLIFLQNKFKHNWVTISFVVCRRCVVVVSLSLLLLFLIILSLLIFIEIFVW